MINHHQKGFAVIPIIIILAVLAVGGYWWYSPNRKIGPGETPPILIGKTVRPVSWPRYRSEQYGFEVGYPNGWEYGITIGGDLTLKLKDKPGNYPSFQITPFAIGGTSVDILKSSSEYEGLSGWESITIDGYPGITKKVIKDSKVVDGRVVPGEIYYVGYLVEGPKFIYQIRTSQEKDIDFEANKILLNDQILSTFKFLR